MARGIADILMVSGQTLPPATILDWRERWLESRAVEARLRIHERQETSLRRSLAFLGSSATRNLESLSQAELIKGRISSLASKTRKRLGMALAKPLSDYLATLPSGDDLKAFVFRRAATLAREIQQRSRLTSKLPNMLEAIEL